MSPNIDDIADRNRGNKSPSERLRETFLRSRPQSQWPPYLDETAIDFASGIVIGDTDLDKQNFPSEVGPVYREGLLAGTAAHSDLPETLTELDAADLGRAMYLLNRLKLDIGRSDTGLENTQRAVTAVLEKVLSDTAESAVTPHLGGESNSTSDVLVRMLADPDVAARIDTVLEAFEDAYRDGLLATLDEPQMMTPLWAHQRDALESWLAAGGRGYVDMATATGKTVLGLAAIAAYYGSLHPLDADVEPLFDVGDGKAEVLVVAHNDLILEQWRREFDRHLNIPTDRTRGSDDVELTWGRIHFRTAQTLVNRDRVDYDLVVLDEAHHYASGTGWGQLLSEFDDRVLALSGSVDADSDDSSRVRERLESTLGPECKRYTLAQARRDGVIPTFEWTVAYAGASSDGEFVEITEKARTQFDRFRERVASGALTVEADRRLRTFEDMRQFSHTTEGSSLKRDDEQFRELATTLFSRRTQQWNQSAEIDAVTDVVSTYRDRKVVVLTNNNAQRDAVIDRLRELGFAEDRLYAVRRSDSSHDQRDTVEAFDEPGEPGVLVGTGDLLGEGVDMRHAEVGVNMATGSVNKQLIQRIGRVLRNPDGDKHAEFVNVVGIPVDRDAQVPQEDGQRLIEDAEQLRAFGDSFGNDPVFAAADGVEPALERLLRGGYDRITDLDTDGVYDWLAESERTRVMRDMLAAVRDHCDADGAAAVLAAWSPAASDRPTVEPVDRDGDAASDTDDTGDGSGGGSEDGEVVLTVVSEDGTPVMNAAVSLTGESGVAYGTTDDDGQITFSIQNGSYTASIHKSGVGIRTADVTVSGASTAETVTLEPEGSL